jgi:predicted restriction endonuclease
MSDLPSLMHEALLRFKQELPDLRRGGGKQSPRPHKLVMLLAVLDLAEAGKLTTNQIYFDKVLVDRFEANFEPYATQDDLCQPAPPFFHLRSSEFWFHHVIPGRERAYAALTTSGGGSKRILENVEYAYLRDDVFLLFNNADARADLRDHILHLLKWPTVITDI